MENQQHSYRSEVVINHHNPTRPHSAHADRNNTSLMNAASSTASTSTIPPNRNPRKTLLSRQPRPQGVLAMKELQKTVQRHRPSSATSRREQKLFENVDDDDEEQHEENNNDDDSGNAADIESRIVRGGASNFTPMVGKHRNLRPPSSSSNRRRSSSDGNDNLDDDQNNNEDGSNHATNSKKPKGPSIYDLSLMSPRAVIESAAASSEASQFTVLLQPFKSSCIQGRASMYVNNCGGIVVKTPTASRPQSAAAAGRSSSSTSQTAHHHTVTSSSSQQQQQQENVTHLGTVSGAHPLHARFSVDRTAPAGTILGATAKVVCPQDEANFVVFVHDTQSKTTLSINMNVLLREERRASVQKDMQELRDALELAKRHSDDLRAQLTRTANERDRALDRIRDVEIDVQRLTADRNRLSAKERAIEQDTERLRDLEQRLLQQRAREDEQEQEMQQARAREREAMKQRESERQIERQQELERAKERDSERKAIEAERARMNAERIQYAKDRQAFAAFMKQVDAERAAFQEREQEWRSSIQSAMSDVAVCEACVSRKDLEKNVEVAIQRVKEMEAERDKMASELKKVVDAEAARLSSALSLGQRIPRNFSIVAGSCETFFPLSQAQLAFRGAVHRGRIFIFIQPRKTPAAGSMLSFNHQNKKKSQQKKPGESPGLLELAGGESQETPNHFGSSFGLTNSENQEDNYSKMKCLIGLRGSNASHVVTSISPHHYNHNNNSTIHSSFNSHANVLQGHSDFEEEMLEYADHTSHAQWLSSSGSTSVTSFFNESEAPPRLLRLSVEPLPGSYCLSGNKQQHYHQRRGHSRSTSGQSTGSNQAFELDNNNNNNKTTATTSSPHHHAQNEMASSTSFSNNNIASSLKDLSKRVLAGWNQMKKRQELLGQVPISVTNDGGDQQQVSSAYHQQQQNPVITSSGSHQQSPAPPSALERRMSLLSAGTRRNSSTVDPIRTRRDSLVSRNSPVQRDASSFSQHSSTSRQNTASNMKQLKSPSQQAVQQQQQSSSSPPQPSIPLSASHIPSADFDSIVKKCRYLQGWAIGAGGAGSHPTALLLNATPLLESVIPEGSQVLCLELAPGGTLGSSGVAHILKHFNMVAYHHQTQRRPAAPIPTPPPFAFGVEPSSPIDKKINKKKKNETDDDTDSLHGDDNGSPTSDYASTNAPNGNNNNNTQNNSPPSPSPPPPPSIEMRLRFATCLEVTDEVDNVAHPLERVEEMSATVFPAPVSVIRDKLWNARDDCALMKNTARGMTTNLLYDARQEKMALEKRILANSSTSPQAGTNTNSSSSLQNKTIATAFTPAVFPFCVSTIDANSQAASELFLRNSPLQQQENSSPATNVSGDQKQKQEITIDGRHPFQDSELNLDSVVNISSNSTAGAGAGGAGSDASGLSNNASFANLTTRSENAFGQLQESHHLLPSPSGINNNNLHTLFGDETEELRQASFAQLLEEQEINNNKNNINRTLSSLEYSSRRYRYMQVQLRGDGNKTAGIVGDVTICPLNFDRSTGHVFIAVHRKSDGLILRKRVGRVINGVIDGITYDDRGPKRSKATIKNWNKLRNLTTVLGNTGVLKNDSSLTLNAGSMRLEGSVADLGATMGSMRLLNNRGGAPPPVKYIKSAAGEKTVIDTENGDFEDIRMVVIEFDNDEDAEQDIENDGGEKTRAGRYMTTTELEQLRDAVGFSVCNFDEIWAKKLEEHHAHGKPSNTTNQSKSSSSSNKNKSKSSAAIARDESVGIRTGTRLLHITFAGVALFDPYKVYRQHTYGLGAGDSSLNIASGGTAVGLEDDGTNIDEDHVRSCSVEDIEFIEERASSAAASDHQHQLHIQYPRPVRLAFGANVAVTNSRGSLLVQPGPLSGTFRAGLRCNNGVISKTPAPGTFLLPRFSLLRCLPSSPLPATLTVSMASLALDELYFDTSATGSTLTIVPNTRCVDGQRRTVILYNRCQIGVVECQQDEKLVVQLNGLATAAAVQDLVRSFAFRAGASDSSAASATLPRNVNIEMSIFGRTQWTDTIHLTAASPLISFPFDAPLSKTEGDPVSDPIFNVAVSSTNSTANTKETTIPSASSPSTSSNTTAGLMKHQAFISIPPELETLTNRSSLAVLVDIMPANLMGSSKTTSADQLPVQINMSRQALLHSGLVLKTCRASSASWPQQWLKRIAATATLQHNDKDARWIQACSHSSSPSSAAHRQDQDTPSSSSSITEIETFDLAASPTVSSFTSDEDAATVERSTGLNRVASIAFVGTGTLLMVFPSAAANWLDDSLAELAREGLLPVDLESPPLIKASHIQGAIRSISAAVYSSLASASQCICSIRLLTEGNGSSSSSSSGATNNPAASSVSPADGGMSMMMSSPDYDSDRGLLEGGSAFSPCTENDYERRALEAQQVLRSAGAVVPRGRSIPSALHSFSSILYIHAASTLTSLSNIDNWTRGRFTAPPNSFGRALLAPFAKLSQAPLSWSRGLVNVSVHIESKIPEGLEPAVLIHNESTYLGNTPLTMSNPLTNKNSAMNDDNNNNYYDDDGGRQQYGYGSSSSSSGLKLNAKDRPWFKLGVVRAVPEWEALLKLSKHSPKVFSVVSKNELFGIQNFNFGSSINQQQDSDSSFRPSSSSKRRKRRHSASTSSSTVSSSSNSSRSDDSNSDDDSSSDYSSSSSSEDEYNMIANDDSHEARRKRLQALTSMDTDQILENYHNENFNVLCFNGRCVGTVSTNNFYDEIPPPRQQQQSSSSAFKNAKPKSASASPQSVNVDLSAEEVPLAAPPTETRGRTGSLGRTLSVPGKGMMGSVAATTSARRGSTGSNASASSKPSSPGLASQTLSAASTQPTTAPLFTATMTNLGAAEVSSFISSLQLVLRPSATSADSYGFEKFSSLPSSTSVRINVSCKPPSSDATWSVDLNAGTKVIWHSAPLVYDSGEPVPRYLFSKIPSSTLTSNGFNLSPFGLLSKRCHVGNFGLMHTGGAGGLDVNEAALPPGTTVSIEALPSIAAPALSQQDASFSGAPSRIECSFDLNSATADLGSSRHAFSLVPHADSVLSQQDQQQQHNYPSAQKSSKSSNQQQQVLRHGAVYSGRTCIAEYDNIDGSCMSISQHKGNMKTKMLSAILRSAQVSIEAVSAPGGGNKDLTTGGGKTSSKHHERRKSLPTSTALGTPTSTTSSNRLTLLPSTTTVCVTFRDRIGGIIETYFIELFWPGSINTPVGCPFTILPVPRRRLQIAHPSYLQSASQNSFTVAPSLFVLVGSQEPCRVGSDLFLAWGTTKQQQDFSSSPNYDESPQRSNYSSAGATKLPRIYAEWSTFPVKSTLNSASSSSSNQQDSSTSSSTAGAPWVNSLERGVALRPLSCGSNNYFIPSESGSLNNNKNNLGTMDGRNSNSNSGANFDDEYYFGNGQFLSEEERMMFEDWIKATFSSTVSNPHHQHGKQKTNKRSRGGSRRRHRSSSSKKKKRDRNSNERPPSSSSNSRPASGLGGSRPQSATGRTSHAAAGKSGGNLGKIESRSSFTSYDERDQHHHQVSLEDTTDFSSGSTHHKMPRFPHFFQRVQRLHPSVFRRDAIRNSLISASTSFGGGKEDKSQSSPASDPLQQQQQFGSTTINNLPKSNSSQHQQPVTTCLPSHWKFDWRDPAAEGDTARNKFNQIPSSPSFLGTTASSTNRGTVEKLLFLQTGTIRPEPCSDPIARILREDQNKLVLSIDEIELASLIAFLSELRAIKSDLPDDSQLLNLPLTSRVVKLFISSIVESFLLMVSAEARPAGTGEAFNASAGAGASDSSVESILRNLGHVSFGVIWDQQGSSNNNNKNFDFGDNNNRNKQSSASATTSATALCRRDLVADVTADPRGAAEMFGLASALKTTTTKPGTPTIKSPTTSPLLSTTTGAGANKRIPNPLLLHQNQTQEIFLRNFSWETPLVTPFSRDPLKIGMVGDLAKYLPNFLMTNITVKFSYTLLCKDPVARQKQLASALEEQQEALDEYKGLSSTKKLVVRRRSTLANLGLLSLTDLGNLSATARPGMLEMNVQNKEHVKSFNVTNAMNTAAKLHPMPHLLIRWGFVNEYDDPDDQSSAINDNNSFDISRAPSVFANYLTAFQQQSSQSAVDQQQQQQSMHEFAHSLMGPSFSSADFSSSAGIGGGGAGGAVSGGSSNDISGGVNDPTISINPALSDQQQSQTMMAHHASLLVSNIARPWEEVMAVHTINAEASFLHGDYSAGFVDDEDTDFTANEQSARNLLMNHSSQQGPSSSQFGSSPSTSGQFSPGAASSLSSSSYASDLRQIFSLPMSAGSVVANNNGGTSLTTPLFVITQQQSASKVVAAARYRVRTSSHLRHQVLNAALAMASSSSSAASPNSHFSNFSFGTMMMPHQQQASHSSMMMQHLSPKEQQQTMIQMIVKSQLQSDCELTVAFRDGYKVSRRALERLIGRVAVFPNSSFSSSSSSSSTTAAANNSNSISGSFAGQQQQQQESSNDKNAYHLFAACTVVDRTTDTVLARIDNSDSPIVLHM